MKVKRSDAQGCRLGSALLPLSPNFAETDAGPHDNRFAFRIGEKRPTDRDGDRPRQSSAKDSRAKDFDASPPPTGARCDDRRHSTAAGRTTTSQKAMQTHGESCSCAGLPVINKSKAGWSGSSVSATSAIPPSGEVLSECVHQRRTAGKRRGELLFERPGGGLDHRRPTPRDPERAPRPLPDGDNRRAQLDPRDDRAAPWRSNHPRSWARRPEARGRRPEARGQRPEARGGPAPKERPPTADCQLLTAYCFTYGLRPDWQSASRNACPFGRADPGDVVISPEPVRIVPGGVERPQLRGRPVSGVHAVHVVVADKRRAGCFGSTTSWNTVEPGVGIEQRVGEPVVGPAGLVGPAAMTPAKQRRGEACAADAVLAVLRRAVRERLPLPDQHAGLRITHSPPRPAPPRPARPPEVARECGWAPRPFW